jgi:hypothetical protein
MAKNYTLVPGDATTKAGKLNTVSIQFPQVPRGKSNLPIHKTSGNYIAEIPAEALYTPVFGSISAIEEERKNYPECRKTVEEILLDAVNSELNVTTARLRRAAGNSLVSVNETNLASHFESVPDLAVKSLFVALDRVSRSSLQIAATKEALAAVDTSSPEAMASLIAQLKAQFNM